MFFSLNQTRGLSVSILPYKKRFQSLIVSEEPLTELQQCLTGRVSFHSSDIVSAVGLRVELTVGLAEGLAIGVVVG